MTELSRLTLVEALAGLQACRFSCEQYAQACLTAIAHADAQIGAWEWLDLDRAMATARALDRQRQTGTPTGGLWGIPIAVKDIMFTRGIPTTMGSRVFAGHVPGENAAVVDKLQAAGAWVLGKTVTTEFAFRTPGKTKNPWNAKHTPGGSSSGSAAAVATGMVPVALGSQTLGSIIRPAAFCGVVGYKPSLGTISRHGVYPFAKSLDHVGVFSRSVGDAALLASYLRGEDSRDGASRATGDLAPAKLTAPPRLALVRSSVWALADTAQREALYRAAHALRAQGAHIDEVELPAEFNTAQDVIQTIMRYEAAQVFAPIKQKTPDLVSSAIDEVIKTGSAFTPTQYQAALASQARLQASLERFLADYQAIITPPAVGEAPEGLEFTGDPAFCTTWSLCGAPAITIPIALGPRGLPLGLQIVGSHGQDAAILGVAQWCEARLAFAYRLLS
jgi:Asp-tRNA(Asn)/Glu-tRNA(Gln) amidotransferase A subunit family amidase